MQLLKWQHRGTVTLEPVVFVQCLALCRDAIEQSLQRVVVFNRLSDLRTERRAQLRKLLSELVYLESLHGHLSLGTPLVQHLGSKTARVSWNLTEEFQERCAPLVIHLHQKFVVVFPVRSISFEEIEAAWSRELGLTVTK